MRMNSPNIIERRYQSPGYTGFTSINNQINQHQINEHQTNSINNIYNRINIVSPASSFVLNNNNKNINSTNMSSSNHNLSKEVYYNNSLKNLNNLNSNNLTLIYYQSPSHY
jgi:hypothetical protein